MAKFCGMVGFAVTDETSPGVWVKQITERQYYGDLLNNYSALQGNGVNDDINVRNKISIIADPFAEKNVHDIRYVTFMGAKWKISDVSVEYPRLILTVGGLYNG